ncbi:extracellular solute-binding protein [Nitrincola sp. A-D6]|uniref:extracellular solute-binding protein n=1 Tax=Nitrincola sp. A-D6 TaxID=1545442 RepID=UPI000A696078|nr:extracellular solute-binding protein [Nitrincola sp. A-D6]
MKSFTQKATMTAATLLLSSSLYAAGELKLYNWSDYMPQELIDKFSSTYDVRVIQDSYDSNETLLARLKSGVTGYDVAVPGDYMVAIMIEEGLLDKVQPHTLENFKHIKEELVDVYFDPGREYSIPYQFGTTSFMVDTDAIRVISIPWRYCLIPLMS